MSTNNYIRTNNHFYSCPIAGLQIEAETIVIGDLSLVKLNKWEWGDIEKAYIHLDWHADYDKINPIFVYHEFKEDSNEEIEINEIDKRISRLISALRLHKFGIVHDPSFTVKFLKNNMWTHREVGPYRDEYLTSIADGLVYNLSNDEVEQVELIYQSLLKLESYNNTDLIENLINSFDLSFLPTLSSRFKLSILYTTLEMLYNVSPKIFKGEINEKSSLYQRAFAMIDAEYGPIKQTDDLYRFYCESSDKIELEIHKIRKIVHHLKEYNAKTNADQVIVYLQETLRRGIWLLGSLYHLKFLERYNTLLDEVSLNLSPKELLNLALHRLFNGDNKLLEKILTS